MKNVVSVSLVCPDYGLTPRELDVLALAAQGLSGPQIAIGLGLRFYTIGSHLKQIHKKLGVHNRAAAVAVALTQGLLEDAWKTGTLGRGQKSRLKFRPRCGSGGNGLDKGKTALNGG